MNWRFIDQKPVRNQIHCLYDDIKQVSDIKDCWNDLKLSIIRGKFSKTAEKFSKEANECTLQIIEYVAAKLGEINQTAKSIPIRSRIDKDKNHQDIEFLNNLIKGLDKIPDELKIYIPEHSPLKDQITDTLLEDLLTVQNLCCNRIKLLKRHSKSYDKVIERLKLGKKTRKNDLMISGEKPIPQYMLQIDPELSPEEVSAAQGTLEDGPPTRPANLDLEIQPIAENYLKPHPRGRLKSYSK